MMNLIILLMCGIVVEAMSHQKDFTILTSQQPKQQHHLEDGEAFDLVVKVEGLQGDSLSIKDKVSGETLNLITVNGEYIFPSQVLVGDRYRLKMTKQPQQPDQTCTIVNGTGVMTRHRYENKKITITCRTPIRHVVIIGIDGMGGAYLQDSENLNPLLNVRKPNIPTLDALRSQSSWTFFAQDALPTSSSTNWCSMLGGNPPDVHGVLSNTWQRGDSIIPPTLFSIARDEYPMSQIGLLYDWSGLGRLIEDDIANVKYSPGDAAQTANAAIDFISANKPLLTFIHLDACDGAGHGYGWGSEQYIQALESVDGLVSNIVEKLIDEGMWDYTALLISSDHGGEDDTHGSDTLLERAIPFILRTPQTNGHKIKQEVRIWDVAATAAALLGIVHPSYWVSSPVYEAIPFPPEMKTLTTSKNYYREVDDFSLIYDTSGTSMNNELTILRPNVPSGYVSLGDIAIAHGNGQSTVCIPDSITCSCTNDQTDYRGTIAMTISGKSCQKWTEQFPHIHSRTPENYPNAGLGDHNYCRNPDGEDRAWCYTTDTDLRWEFCDVPSCPLVSNDTTIAVLEDHPSVTQPIGFELIWSSEGTSDNKQLALWNPIPQSGYNCPGQIASTTYNEPPPLSSVACILETYLNGDDVQLSTFVWNDSGSGAALDGSIWKCEGDNASDKILDPGVFVSRQIFDDAGNNDCRVLRKLKFQLCQDDQDFKFQNDEMKNCSWVGKQNARCNKKWKKKRVHTYCAVTCGEC